MIPRRIQQQQRVAAEILIDAARDAVEAMPADVRLTDAVVLLGAARDSVSDFVDGIDKRRYVTEGRQDGPERLRALDGDDYQMIEQEVRSARMFCAEYRERQAKVVEWARQMRVLVRQGASPKDTA